MKPLLNNDISYILIQKAVTFDLLDWPVSELFKFVKQHFVCQNNCINP